MEWLSRSAQFSADGRHSGTMEARPSGPFAPPSHGCIEDQMWVLCCLNGSFCSITTQGPTQTIIGPLLVSRETL